jgi:hypothetical protein
MTTCECFNLNGLRLGWAPKALGESRYKIAMEGLALSIVVYGLASGVPAATATGLAALLAGLDAVPVSATFIDLVARATYRKCRRHI